MSEADIVEKVKAKGDEIRALKAEGSDIAEKLSELAALKVQFKELTGKDWDPPKQKKVKKQEQEPQLAEGGMTKTALKKAAKMEKKKAKKSKSDEPQSSPRMQAFELIVGRGCSKLDTHKCIASALFVGAPIVVSSSSCDHPGAEFMPILKLPSNELLCGPASICGYLASSFTGSSFTESAEDNFREWVDSTLTPAVNDLLKLLESQKVALPLRSAKPQSEHVVHFDEYSLAYEYAMMDQTNTVNGTDISVTGSSIQQAYSSVTEMLDTVGARFQDGKFSVSDVMACSSLSHLTGIIDSQPKVVLNAIHQFGDLWKDTAALMSSIVLPPSATDISLSFDGSFVKYLGECFRAAISAAFPAVDVSKLGGKLVVRSREPKFGDYQCNQAMSIFKEVRPSMPQFRKPSDVAQAIVNALPASTSSVVGNISIAPTGFINVSISSSFTGATLSEMLLSGPRPPAMKKRRVVVDFSSPNIAKEMHVGHLRSTIIGDTICRTLEFAGHDVVRTNHVGDWGTQFGMLILYMKEAYPNFLTDPPNISDLTTFYKQAKKRFDEDEEFKDTARRTVVKLQSGDPECHEIWNLLCDISRKEFEKVYTRLDVTLSEVGESFYNSRIPEAVRLLKEQGLVEESDGAQCIFMKPKWSYPLFLVKRDGGYGYDSTDMAAIRYRLNEVGADWVIVITDAGQADHFFMCFEAARRAGWIDDKKHRFAHMGFGVVQGEDGKRFKTRSGDTVRLVDLLDEAKDRMKASLEDRMSQGKCQLDPQDLDEAAARIGYGAVKYFDLSQHISTDYKFSYDKMLDVKGDTAVYLMFAFSRFASIVRKGASLHGVDVNALAADKTPITLNDPFEVTLGLELLQLPDILESVMDDLLPHRLCEYLHHLCVKGTAFVTNCHVLGTPEMQSRLLLCSATCKVMSKCFELLGINPVDRI